MPPLLPRLRLIRILIPLSRLSRPIVTSTSSPLSSIKTSSPFSSSTSASFASFKTSSATMTSSPPPPPQSPPSESPLSEVSQLTKDIASLLTTTNAVTDKGTGESIPGGGGKWRSSQAGAGAGAGAPSAIERTFKFKTFAKTWDFMTAVALQCKLKNHHPEWYNVYNTTFIRWTTHSAKGLTALDVAMARACDALAEDFGVLDVKEGEDDGSQQHKSIRDMLDRASEGAGDCCGPPKKKSS